MARPHARPLPALILITLLVNLATPGIAWAEGETPPAEPQAPVEASGDAPLTVPEILEAAPAGTEVQVVDPAGTPEPLASLEAAQALLESDPIWCDTSATPVCTPPQASVAALVSLLASDPTTYFGDGTIYFTTDYSTNDAQIRGGDLTALRALTIDGQGHTISVPIEVTGWLYDVSLNDLHLSGASGTATMLRVETSGAIHATQVTVTGSGGDGAYLDNTSGTASIDVANSSFSGNTWTGLDARSNGDIDLDTLTAGGQEDGAYLDASTGTGTITVTDSDFSSNTLAGLTARTADGDITLTNTTADSNGPAPAPTTVMLAAPSTVAVGSSQAYGLGLTSTAGGSIGLSASYARQNEGRGLWIEGTGPITLNGVTASDNGADGAYVHNLGACQAAPILVTVDGGSFEDNAGYGVQAVLGPGGVFALLGSPLFANNALGDYLVNLDPCPECDKGGEGKPYNTIYVPEIGIPPVPLDCETFAGTIFVLPNGDRLKLVCPVAGEATATPVPIGGLPGPLPPGRSFVSGANLDLTKDGQPVLILTEGGYLTVSFTIPQALQGKSLAILYWDPVANDGAGGWVELPPYAARPDGSPIVHRLHPAASPDDLMYILGGVRTSGDTVKVKVNFTGTFVLVER